MPSTTCPDACEDLDSVEKHGSIEIPDLLWIVACLGIRVRLTIAEDVYQHVEAWYPWISRDSMIGPEQADRVAHVLFSWQKDCAEGSTRKFGHFDVLCPRKQRGQGDYQLLSHAACKHHQASNLMK